jgi:Ca2+-dependent lipid-binding protein
VNNSGSNTVTKDSETNYETSIGNSIIASSYSITGTVTTSSTATLGSYCGYSANSNAHMIVFNAKATNPIGSRSSSARYYYTATSITAYISKLNTAWGSTVYQFDSSGIIVPK